MKQKVYKGIHEDVVVRAKNNKLQNGIKKLSTHIQQTKKESLQLHRIVRDSFHGLWARRKYWEKVGCPCCNELHLT